MASLFKIIKQVQEDIAPKPMTRFKRVHVRGVPEPERDNGIDPLGNFTRTERKHVRKMPELSSGNTPATSSAEQPKPLMNADLHASDAISIDVLRKALPSRFRPK